MNNWYLMNYRTGAVIKIAPFRELYPMAKKLWNERHNDESLATFLRESWEHSCHGVGWDEYELGIDN